MTPSDQSISAATIAQPPNLLAAGIASSQLHGAMRKSRQPRCNAAISGAASANAPKPLTGSQNLK
jgi:hypothetical protein